MAKKHTSRSWRRLWPAAVLVFAGCDGSIGARGRVLDAGGEPIAGAQVTLANSEESYGFEAETRSNGCFEIGGLVAPGEREYELAVSAPGHQTAEGEFRSVGEYAVLVELAADGSKTPSAIERLSDDGAPPELEPCLDWGDEATNDAVDTAAAAAVPKFDDYPAADVFAGEPAAVDLESHPEAASFRSALTRDAEIGAREARFAGHYRIVVIGCGASCKSVWAVDLVDGSVHKVFSASYGLAFQPESRLIIENDPETYESLIGKMTAAEVEEMMATYGPPKFWVEDGGEFEQVGPREFRVDAETGKVVPGRSEAAAASWRCTNDVEVTCAEGACEAKGAGEFTPMSIEVAESGAMSVCAYTGCWEGDGEVLDDGRFLVLVGRDLAFSTSPAPQAREDIVVAIDRSDRVGTLKAGAFALPLLCKSPEDAS